MATKSKEKTVKEDNKVELADIKKECFVIMPISDPEGYENGHFKRVYQDIFKPAIGKAGFIPYRADDNNSASLIQLDIIKKLIESPMAICDLSSRNPNVLFELGIRQAFDKPVVLVQECGTPRIFDISSINTIDYKKELIYHEVLEDQEIIAKAVSDTFANSSNGNSINSIINLLSINPAKEKVLDEIKEDPRMQLVMVELARLRNEMKEHFINKYDEIDINKNIKNKEIIDNIIFAKRKYHECEEKLKRIEETKVFDPSLINEIEEYISYCNEMYSIYRVLEFRDIGKKLKELYGTLKIQQDNNLISKFKKTLI